jgi:dienelactone hydrolase
MIRVNVRAVSDVISNMLWRLLRAAGLLSIVAAYLIFTSGAIAREPLRDRVSVDVRGIAIEVFFYRPKGCSQPALLFVFHGLSRAAASYRSSARDAADRYCMIVYAPLFDEDRFPNWKYHRGGIVRNDEVLPEREWTVTLVRDLVLWAREREGRPNAPLYLFGHSAGGQFLSRVAAFGPPLEASRIVIANPSTYVLPSTREPAPYGLGGIFSPSEAERRLRAYLERPVTIFLGDQDTGEKDLARGRSAERQGSNRLERGENTFRKAQEVAEANGWKFGWQLVRASGIAHSGREMLQADELRDAFGLRELTLQR